MIESRAGSTLPAPSAPGAPHPAPACPWRAFRHISSFGVGCDRKSYRGRDGLNFQIKQQNISAGRDKQLSTSTYRRHQVEILRIIQPFRAQKRPFYPFAVPIWGDIPAVIPAQLSCPFHSLCVTYFCVMDLWDAIREMRRLTAEGIYFSFSFMSYNASARKSEGVVEVRRARLLKREKQQHHRDAEFVEAYLDVDTNAPRRFYQPLLLSFNGQKVILR